MERTVCGELLTDCEARIVAPKRRVDREEPTFTPAAPPTRRMRAAPAPLARIAPRHAKAYRIPNGAVREVVRRRGPPPQARRQTVVQPHDRRERQRPFRVLALFWSFALLGSVVAIGTAAFVQAW